MKWKLADTVIPHTSLPNLRHPATVMSPLLLKRHKSTINILHESDIVPTQALPVPMPGGNHSVPQPMAGGDHNVPEHQKATFEAAKLFMKASILTKIPWPIMSDEKYSMIDEAS
jgi:hypothetical protein